MTFQLSMIFLAIGLQIYLLARFIVLTRKTQKLDKEMLALFKQLNREFREAKYPVGEAEDAR